MENSQIKSFFKNQTVFLTGGSGFLGKVLIEKLLRECEDVEKIYVLIRPKKGKNSEERFEELFDFPCFDVLKSKNIDSLKKVCLINGDCQLPLLGLNEQDRAVLLRETTCVIHAAANVKFDQTLKEASFNVRATKDLLEMAKKMSHLKAFVFVSTAYSNCLNSHIREEFYEPPMKAENLLTVVNSLDEDVLLTITPEILGEWPNTYVYTKSISEDLVQRASADVPVVVVRPAIVISSLAEPIPGWVDNVYGAIGVVLGAALGIIRSFNVKPDALAQVVPVDYVSNCILAAAWYRERAGTTGIYNFAHRNSGLTWNKFVKAFEEYYWSNAPTRMLWYYCFQLRENQMWHRICILFLHMVPAYIVDFILFCLRKPTLAVRNYQRLNKMLDSIAYFVRNIFIFDDNGVTNLWNHMNEVDKKIFFFNLKDIEWKNYIRDCASGCRLYLLKDTADTIPQGKRKAKILFVLHYTVVALFYYLLYKLVMFVIEFFF